MVDQRLQNLMPVDELWVRETWAHCLTICSNNQKSLEAYARHKGIPLQALNGLDVRAIAYDFALFFNEHIWPTIDRRQLKEVYDAANQ